MANTPFYLVDVEERTFVPTPRYNPAALRTFVEFWLSIVFAKGFAISAPQPSKNLHASRQVAANKGLGFSSLPPNKWRAPAEL